MQDRALDEREHAYYGPRMGDWLVLGVVVVALLANGLYVWHQLGPVHDHTGRAIFFGLALLAAFWATLVFTFKLSVCVRVGAHGMSIVRGPWHTELAWAQVTRLVERMQVVNQRRLRWLVAIARDGRSLQVREDMVADYTAFRVEVWERYRLWRDHGGTWGTTGGGPFTARETASSQTTWWSILGLAALLPGLYCSLILPELGMVGPILLLVAAAWGVLALRAVLRRRTYTVDARAIQSKLIVGTTRLAWRDVKKVERVRRSFGGMTELGIHVGRASLGLVARGDSRVQSFDWTPRVPEYLMLRGAGRQVLIRLHRLERPDEMLAWIEFYERAGRHLADMQESRRTAPSGARTGAGTPTTKSLPDLARAATMSRPVAQPADSAGPVDPWGAGRDGQPQPAGDSEAGREHVAPPGALGQQVEPTPQTSSGDSSAAWLRAETSSAWHPGMRMTTPPQSSFETRHGNAPVGRAEGAGADGAGEVGAAPDDGRSAPRPDEWQAGSDRPRTGTAPPAMAERAPEPTYDRWSPPAWQAQPAHATEQTPPTWPAQPPQGWQPAQPAWERPPVSSPLAGPAPARQAPTPEPGAGGVADEVPPEAAEDAATDSVEPLADAFKLWGAQATGERPRFPRYGPPPEPESTGAADAQQLERDDFLR